MSRHDCSICGDAGDPCQLCKEHEELLRDHLAQPAPPQLALLILSGGIADPGLIPWDGGEEAAIKHLDALDWKPFDDDAQLWRWDGGSWVTRYVRDPDEDCSQCYKASSLCNCPRPTSEVVQ